MTTALPPHPSTAHSRSLAGAALVDRPVRVELPRGHWMPKKLIITIDGPAGTGKSSVARALARRLGMDFLDTGAMYRAAALIAIEAGIPLDDPARIVIAVRSQDMRFDFSIDPPELLCSGRSVMERIRTQEVTGIVSPIAAIAALRQDLVARQRQIAHEHPRLVTEGRDQGTVVFPDADVKLYLDASAEVRALRRAEQAGLVRPIGTAGAVSTPDARAVDQLRREIIARDASDSSRTDGPLMCPCDAKRIDTSHMSFDQVVEALEAHVRAHVDAARLAGKV